MNKKTILSIAAVSALAIQAYGDGDVSFGGFISNGFLKSSDHNYLADSKDGDFSFVEAGVNATWSPMDRTMVRGQLFTFELGPYGDFDPIVDYLFVDYNVSRAFGARLGRVKRPEGIYTDIQDIDVARTSILLPIGMYDQRYRDFSASIDGLSLYGNLSAGNNQSIDYNVYYGFVDIGVDSGVGGYAQTLLSKSLLDADVQSLESDTNTGVQLWWNTALSGLRLGVSYSIYDNIDLVSTGTIPGLNLPILSESASDVTNSRLSAEYYYGDWTFVSEYNQMESDSTSRQTVAGELGQWEKGESTGYSWYVSAARRFLQDFEGGITYGEFYDNKDLTSHPIDYQKDLQFSLRYNATDRWTLKAEVHSMKGLNRLFNEFGQNPAPADSSWTLFAAKSTFTF